MYGVKAQKINFPDIEFVRVEPPTAKKSFYSLPKGFGADEEEEYPLMDSNNQVFQFFFVLFKTLFSISINLPTFN